MSVGAHALPRMDVLAERQAQFRELLHKERDRAVAVAYHMVGDDREVAKEVAQEAFLKAHMALPRFRGDAKMSTWFMRILLRECGRYRRWRGVRRRFAGLFGDPATDPLLDGPDPLPSPDACAQASKTRARIALAMNKLTEPQRAAFTLIHLEGLSVEQAAEAMDKASGTVKSHLHRALKRLREELEDLRKEAADEQD